MDTHQKKRIEIIIEALLAEEATQIIDRSGAMGYSILPLIGGKGLSGSWSSDGQVSQAQSKVAIICIIDARKADDLLTTLFPIVSRQMGIISVSDVSVIRSEHF